MAKPWTKSQRLVMTTARTVADPTDINERELSRMRSAFNLGVRPRRVEFDGDRLWVAVYHNNRWPSGFAFIS